ncbi:MAG: type II secretion system protein [Oligosphaeraceae bacterium]
MQRHSFTLTELLMAIGIIVILASIAVPTTISAIKKAEVAKAQAEMTTLVEALKNYESTYGVLPLKLLGATPSDGKISGTSGTYTAYETLIRILQGENLTVNGKAMNKRKVVFLEGKDEGVLTDPWGNDYIVLLDGDGDGKLDPSSTDEPKGLDGKPWRKDIIIWSPGPSGDEDEVTDNVFSFPVLWDKGEQKWVPDTL